MPKFENTFCSQCGGTFGPGDHGYSHCMDHCGHEWKIAPGDWDAAEGRSSVECEKCGVPGERTDKTGEVYWPAT